MSKQIECELRGPITWSDFNRVRDELENIYGKFDYWVELAIFYKGGYDLRIKINNYQSKLTLKKKIEGQLAKKEYELFLEPSQIKPTLNLLHNLNFNKWLFSKVTERYEAKNGNSSCSVKFGTQIGDFIEFEELVENESDVIDAEERIKLISNNFQMPLWDELTYRSIVESSWSEQTTEPLFIEGSLHPQIEGILRHFPKFSVSC